MNLEPLDLAKLEPGAAYLLRLNKYMDATNLESLRTELKRAGERVSPPCTFHLLPPSVESVELRDVSQWAGKVC